MDCSNTSFWCFQFKDAINTLMLVVTLFAIIWGPIVAVRFTRRLDSDREKLKRKHDVFYTLMRTRRAKLTPDHVAALNVIQLEFHSDSGVISAYKRYIDALSRPFPTIEEKTQFETHIRQLDDDLFVLLHEIGRSLEYSFDRRELERFSYTPSGWERDENEIRAFRHLMIEVLSGRRPLPVQQFTSALGQNKFPPPPTG